MGRGPRFVARILVLVVGLAGPALAFAGQRTVTVDIEGHVRSVRTYAASARELLEREGVRPTKADLVLPAHRLQRADRVVFRRAKEVRLVVDGRPRRVVARGLTVGDVLKDLGLVVAPKARVYPDARTRVSPSTSIFVRHAIHAVVRVDGVYRDVISSADTVRNLLTQANIAFTPQDYVYPSRSAEVHDGMWIRVVRVRRIYETRQISIPFGYVARHDPTLESGVRRIVQQGAEGLEVDRYRVRLEDGRRVDALLISSNIVRRPRDHIVRIGTRPPIFNGTGHSASGDASWFNADGLVAAHRSLPIGSTVKVTNSSTGKSVVVRINQRGPFVEGRIIDLSDDAFSQLAPLGAGTIRVHIDY